MVINAIINTHYEEAMKPYLVIARRFRPQIFSEVCGQETIVQTIKNSILLKRTSHAYLFCGPRGTGKTTLARIFAKALNCKQLTEDGQPCNRCQSCKEINHGNSLDVIEIDGASNRGIDDIRQINETVGYTPSSGEYKIYIIDEVHMLTKEAFNALLKTLEEPPKNVKFFLATTEPHKVLPTITSRCLRFDLSRIPGVVIKTKLMEICTELNVEIEEEALDIILQKAEGSLRDAQSLLEQLLSYRSEKITKEHSKEAFGFISDDIFLKLDEAFKQKNTTAAIEIAEQIFSKGVHYQFFFESMLTYFRNIFLAYHNPKSSFHAKTKIYHLSQCERILQILTDIMLQKPFQKKIQLEMSILKIIQVSKEISIDSVIDYFFEGKEISSNHSQKISDSPPEKGIIENSLEVQTKTESPKISHEPISLKKQTKVDNLVRFASVELGGFVK